MSVRKAEGSLVYQLEVMLKEIQPPIWRRFQVPASLTLAQLHDALQIVMGWTDSHLHRFLINGREYAPTGGLPPDYEERFADDDPIWDERRVRLAKLFPVIPAAFLYEYDYGDGWLHVLVVEGIRTARPDVHYPICMAGAPSGHPACPPEDVGGVGGYEELLAVLADPTHEDYEMMRMWAGEDYDPEAFEVEAVNQALRHR